MRTLLIVFTLFVSSVNAEPSYLVHISTDSPADRVRPFEDWGSGTLVDPEYVLTCGHNIEEFQADIVVRFKNGDEIEATVFKRDRIHDLVLLKLDEIRYEEPVKLSEQTRVKTGQTVTVWGFPGDEAESYTGEVKPTILVGALRRAVFWFEGTTEQGVSGGPALIDGKLVGVEAGWSMLPRVRCTNTPPIRKLLKEIP